MDAHYVRTSYELSLVAGFIAIFERIKDTLFHRRSSVTKCEVYQSDSRQSDEEWKFDFGKTRSESQSGSGPNFDRCLFTYFFKY